MLLLYKRVKTGRLDKKKDHWNPISIHAKKKKQLHLLALIFGDKQTEDVILLFAGVPPPPPRKAKTCCELVNTKWSELEVKRDPYNAYHIFF